MVLCFLLDKSALPIEAANSDKERKEAALMDSLLKKRLENLQRDGIISGYTTIEGTYLGFPLSKPANTMIYRVDNFVRDLDKAIGEYESGEAQLDAVRRGCEKAQPTSAEAVENLRQVRQMFYEPASAFFGTEDISRWTAELDALKGVDSNFHPEDDRGCKNELAHEAFLSIIYGSGYVMARAVVADGRLPELEQKLDEKYVRRTILSERLKQKENAIMEYCRKLDSTYLWTAKCMLAGVVLVGASLGYRLSSHFFPQQDITKPSSVYIENLESQENLDIESKNKNFLSYGEYGGLLFALAAVIAGKTRINKLRRELSDKLKED